ncbi:MAG: YbjQ family protein [DPANN group archaeon]|nr:YbjQ family protein [DPANN group archaeon]
MAKPRKGIIISTTDSIPGYEINEIKGIVSGTSVRARFFGKDLIAIGRVLIGGEIPEYANMIRDARKDVVLRAMANAQVLGADAILGLRMESTAQIVPGTVELFGKPLQARAPAPKKRKR